MKVLGCAMYMDKKNTIFFNEVTVRQPALKIFEASIWKTFLKSGLLFNAKVLKCKFSVGLKA